MLLTLLRTSSLNPSACLPEYCYSACFHFISVEGTALQSCRYRDIKELLKISYKSGQAERVGRNSQAVKTRSITRLDPLPRFSGGRCVVGSVASRFCTRTFITPSGDYFSCQ
jgi:hypothetical protein